MNWTKLLSWAPVQAAPTRRPSFENTDPAVSPDHEPAGHRTKVASQDALPAKDACIDDGPKVRSGSRGASRATSPIPPQRSRAISAITAEPVDRAASVTHFPSHTQTESGPEQQSQRPRDTSVANEADDHQRQVETSLEVADGDGPNSPRSSRPSLQKWTSFTKRHSGLMTALITSGDVRRLYNEKAERMAEATSSLAHALLDLESRGTLADTGLSTALTSTVLSTSRELKAAARELQTADEFLIQEEFSLQQIVPQVLGDNSAGTLDLLQAHNLDFQEEEIVDAETVSEGDLNRWDVFDSEVDNGPSAILRRIDDVENQLLLHERSRGRKETQQSSSEDNNGDTAKKSLAKRSESDMQYGLLRGQLSTLRLELEASRGTTSVRSEPLSPAKPSSELREGQQADLEDMLYLSDTEKSPVFPLRLGSSNADDGDKSDQVNAWFLHQMQRSRTELTRWSSHLSEGVRDMADEDVRNLIMEAWFQDRTRTSTHSSVRVEDSNQTSSAPTVPDNHLSAPKQLTRPLSPSLERSSSANESAHREDANATLRLHSESMATRRAH